MPSRVSARKNVLRNLVGTIDCNFAAGNSAGVSVTRSTTAQVVNSDYSLSTAAINAARISCDEIFAASAGLLIEASAVNSASSPTLAGAATGVIGSGGAFPTSWTFKGMPGGITTTITALDATGIEFTFVGTPTGTAGFYVGVNPTGTGGAVCVAGDVWCGSAFVRCFQSTGINSPSDQLFEYYTAAGALIGNSTYKAGAAPQSDKVFPQQYVRTLPATTERLTYYPINPAVVSGTPINAKYRIERPQIEKSAYRSTFQPAATRSADVALLSGGSAYFASVNRTVALSFNAPRLNPNFNVWEERISGDAANNRIEIYTSGYLLKCKVVSGGSTLTDTTIGVVPILTRSTVVLAISPTGITASLNGKTAVTAAITSPTGFNEGQFGGGTTGYLNATIARATFLRTAQSGVSCATLSKAGVTFFDDFDRADGAIGTAPTGQAYTQIAAAGVITVPTISTKRLITADSGSGTTAGYTAVDLLAAAKLMSVAMRFSAATIGGEVALIQNPNGMTTTANITSNSDHHFLASDTMATEYWISSLTTVQTYVFAPVCALDGATEYNGAVAYPGDGSVVWVLPEGELIRSTNTNFATERGRYHTWEHYWSTGQTQPSIRAMAADA